MHVLLVEDDIILSDGISRALRRPHGDHGPPAGRRSHVEGIQKSRDRLDHVRIHQGSGSMGNRQSLR